MRRSIKDYFTFNKSERRGVISLTAIILLIIIFKYCLQFFNPEPIEHSLNLDSLKEVLVEERDAKVKVSRKNKNRIEDKTQQESSLFHFNPNNLPIQKWMDLGLSEKQAAVVKSYEEKGGSFRIKTDVKKMYTISDELYLRLEPYILLPDSSNNYSENKKEYKTSSKTNFRQPKVVSYPKILINSADTAEFKKLYGIGDYYALKIVEYRESLGGFVSKNQLNEIWGLEKETIERLDSQLILNPIPLRKMNVNKASIKGLRAHPYIFWKVANSIVKYREQHGDYKELIELKKSPLINDSLYEKLSPYLEY